MIKVRPNLPTIADFQNEGKKGQKEFINYLRSLKIDQYSQLEAKIVYVRALLFEHVPEMQTYLISHLRPILYPAEVKN